MPEITALTEAEYETLRQKYDKLLGGPIKEPRAFLTLLGFDEELRPIWNDQKALVDALMPKMIGKTKWALLQDRIETEGNER